MNALTPGLLLVWRIHWLFAAICIISLFVILVSLIVKSPKGMHVGRIVCLVSLIIVLLTIPAAIKVRRLVTTGRYWQTFFQNHPRLEELRKTNQ